MLFRSTVRAKVEHGSEGNIVTALGGKSAEPAWFKAPAHCDHCKTSLAFLAMVLLIGVILGCAVSFMLVKIWRL